MGRHQKRSDGEQPYPYGMLHGKIALTFGCRKVRMAMQQPESQQILLAVVLKAARDHHLQGDTAKAATLYEKTLGITPSNLNVLYFLMKNRNSKPYRVNEKGDRISVEKVSDYLVNLGLEIYIKQFFTYHIMAKRFPDQIRLVSYERLTRNPHDTFQEILQFYGHAPCTEERRESFQTALEMSNISSMKAYETRIGRSLFDGSSDSKQQHIGDGKIGKWKQFFDEKTIDFCEKKLASLLYR